MLEQALNTFAAHLRAYGEPGLADAVDGAKGGDPDRLPQRVLALFRHGMGGLLDVPLYMNGVVDPDATRRRDDLAEQVYYEASSQLQTE